MVYRYGKLDIVDFGRRLLSSGDLDPVYLALNRSPWDRDRKLRWLYTGVTRAAEKLTMVTESK